jgi:hypothetical protein
MILVLAFLTRNILCIEVLLHIIRTMTYRSEHAVYIYDTKADARVVVKDDQIKEPRGVAVGPYDTILVCSNKTNSIVQISQTGHILSSYRIEMEYPFRVCVSHDKSFLVVIKNHYKNKKMQNFKIS